MVYKDPKSALGFLRELLLKVFRAFVSDVLKTECAFHEIASTETCNRHNLDFFSNIDQLIH